MGGGNMNNKDHNADDSKMDTIYRQAAIDALGERPMVWAESDYELGARNQYDADVLALETVLPAQLQKGKWIYGEHESAMCDGYRCDKCGFFVPWDYQHKFIDFIKDYNYCPSCGADMEVKND
jgi:rubredoxin